MDLPHAPSYRGPHSSTVLLQRNDGTSLLLGEETLPLADEGMANNHRPEGVCELLDRHRVHQHAGSHNGNDT